MSLTAPKPWDNAGASARREAARLRQIELRTQHAAALRWSIPLALVCGVLFTLADALLPTQLAILVGLTPLLRLRRIYEPSDEVQRWLRGADGERRTARLLHGLESDHWVVLNDRRVPDSNANLDHLVLTPDGLGAVYIDTKTTRGKGQVKVQGNVLKIGRTPYPKALKTVKWEADQAAKALSAPVHPVIAVHGARVPRHGIKTEAGVLVVEARWLRSTLQQIPHRHQPAVLADLKGRAHTNLPPYVL